MLHEGAGDEYAFINTLYIFKSKALEIERLFYKFRSVCLDDSKKKEQLYETLYNELHELTEQLDKVARTLPSRPTNINDQQEIIDTTETKSGEENATQAPTQQALSFTRTSTSTF